jgi:hypothetical protein
MEIHNEDELCRLLEQVATEVINVVSEKVLKKLQDNIEKHTYGSHGPNKVYLENHGPSHQFKYAWEWKAIERGVMEITRELFYNWMKMNYLPESWMHGSLVPGWPEDAREQLAGWLNHYGWINEHFITVYRQPYWDITMDGLLGGGELEKWFDYELKQRGFVRG